MFEWKETPWEKNITCECNTEINETTTGNIKYCLENDFFLKCPNCNKEFLLDTKELPEVYVRNLIFFFLNSEHVK